MLRIKDITSKVYAAYTVVTRILVMKMAKITYSLSSLTIVYFEIPYAYLCLEKSSTEPGLTSVFFLINFYADVMFRP